METKKTLQIKLEVRNNAWVGKEIRTILPTNKKGEFYIVYTMQNYYGNLHTVVESCKVHEFNGDIVHLQACGFSNDTIFLNDDKKTFYLHEEKRNFRNRSFRRVHERGLEKFFQMGLVNYNYEII